MMKDATGTALMAATAGDSSSRTGENRAERAASPAASADAVRKPPKIRPEERASAAQYPGVPASSPRQPSTRRGEGSRRGCPRARLAPCQSSSQKSTGQSFRFTRCPSLPKKGPRAKAAAGPRISRFSPFRGRFLPFYAP